MSNRTSNPQRYDLVPITRGMETWEEMRKADDGDWIRFEDYERLTATLLIQERIAQANLRLFAEAQAERDRLRAALECAYGIWSRFQGEHCTAADEMADVINAALNIGQEIGHAQRTADEHTQSRISENHTGSRIAQPDETSEDPFCGDRPALQGLTMKKAEKPKRMYMLRAQCFAPFYGIAYDKGTMVERLKKLKQKYRDTELRVVRVTVNGSEQRK